jgi:excisionase family DNA binding protein
MTKWLTPEQVAADPRLPRYNADWIRKQLRSGNLRGSRPGGRWLIPEDAIDEMLERKSNVVRRKKKRAS